MSATTTEKPLTAAEAEPARTGDEPAGSPEQPGEQRDEGAPGGSPDTAPVLTIYERMVAILAEMPAVGKTQQNTQQKFMFRGHDDVLNALNPLLSKYGVLVVPDVVERITSGRTTSAGSTMYEVNLHVRYRFIGAGGDWIDASAWGEGTDMGDKSTNKAMTMAFKNVLAQAFAVSTEETFDADAGTPEHTTRAAAASKPITDKQKAMIETRLTKLDDAGHQDFDGRRPQDAVFVRRPVVDLDSATASKLIDLLLKVEAAHGEEGLPARFSAALDRVLGEARPSDGDFPPGAEEEAAGGDDPSGYGG